MTFLEHIGRHGKGWLIREYTADDELVRYEYPANPNGSPKPFPLKPVFLERDFPIWDGGGLNGHLEDEICDFEDDDDEANCLSYYDDIGTEHDYRTTAISSAVIRLSVSRAFAKMPTAAC